MSVRSTTLHGLVVVTSTALLAGCASGPATEGHSQTPAHTTAPGATVLSAKSAAPIAAASATLDVRGMSCPKCANNIDKQLRDLPGVGHVAIDMGTGAVRIAFAGPTHPSPMDLAGAIERTGFTLASISTP